MNDSDLAAQILTAATRAIEDADPMLIAAMNTAGVEALLRWLIKLQPDHTALAVTAFTAGAYVALSVQKVEKMYLTEDV